jgi:hypothetical protein
MTGLGRLMNSGVLLSCGFALMMMIMTMSFGVGGGRYIAVHGSVGLL